MGGGYRDFFIIYTKNGVTNINPALPARHYDMQERKLIEIAKCMYNDPKLLIVDETTTALPRAAVTSSTASCTRWPMPARRL